MTFFPVDEKVVMLDEMPSLGSGVDKAEAVDEIVKPSLQQSQQIGARDSFLLIGTLEKQSELLFRKSVHSFDLLLPHEAGYRSQKLFVPFADRVDRGDNHGDQMHTCPRSSDHL